MHVAGSHRLASSLSNYSVILLTNKTLARMTGGHDWHHSKLQNEKVKCTQHKHIAIKLTILNTNAGLKKCCCCKDKWVYVEETIMSVTFHTSTVRTGCSLHPFAGKANGETDRAHCSHWPTTRALQLIYSHSCLFIEGEGTAFFISWKETKKCCQEQTEVCQTKCTLSKLKVANTMLFTSEGQSCGGKRGGPRLSGISGGWLNDCVTGHANVEWHTFQTQDDTSLQLLDLLPADKAFEPQKKTLQRRCKLKVHVILCGYGTVMMSRHIRWLNVRHHGFIALLYFNYRDVTILECYMCAIMVRKLAVVACLKMMLF